MNGTVFLLFAVYTYGNWQILEPVMKVEVTVPVQFQGAVLGTLNRRHGIIVAQETTMEYFTVLVEVGF